MRTTIALSLTLALATSAALAAEPKADGKLTPMFDGKTLSGWTVRGGTATYKLEDGQVVGKTVEGSPNTFLCSDRDYADFELLLEVKCDPKLNSGIQIRSHVYEKDTPQPSKPKRIRPKGTGLRLSMRDRRGRGRAVGKFLGRGPEYEVAGRHLQEAGGQGRRSRTTSGIATASWPKATAFAVGSTVCLVRISATRPTPPVSSDSRSTASRKGPGRLRSAGGMWRFAP